jgi:hypothetical protein
LWQATPQQFRKISFSEGIYRGIFFERITSPEQSVTVRRVCHLWMTSSVPNGNDFSFPESRHILPSSPIDIFRIDRRTRYKKIKSNVWNFGMTLEFDCINLQIGFFFSLEEDPWRNFPLVGASIQCTITP